MVREVSLDPSLGKGVALRLFLKQFLIILNPFLLLESLWQILCEIHSILKLLILSPDLFKKSGQHYFMLPFRGEWKVANGGTRRETSHSWWILNQRYAYDFARVDAKGKSHCHEGRILENYFSFDQDVFAPEDGKVIRTRDGVRDYRRLNDVDIWTKGAGGNYVMIEHASGIVSFIAHLKKGSICVRKGEKVKTGQAIGRCGNSGNSSEPHIHFQVQDKKIPLAGFSLPIFFRNIFIQMEGEKTKMELGHIEKEQLVSNGQNEKQN